MDKVRLIRIKRRKELEAWSRAVRERDNYTCQMCFGTKNLQAHHIIPKELEKTRLSLLNGVTLCSGCHKWRLYSAHRHTPYFILWLKKFKPEQWAFIEQEITGQKI